MSSTHTTSQPTSKDNLSHNVSAYEFDYMMASVHPQHHKLPMFGDALPIGGPTVEFGPKLSGHHATRNGHDHFSISSLEIEEDRKERLGLPGKKRIRAKFVKRQKREQREHMPPGFCLIELSAKRFLKIGFDLNRKNCGASHIDYQQACREVRRAISKAIRDGFLPPLTDGIAQDVTDTSNPDTHSPVAWAKHMYAFCNYEVARLMHPFLGDDKFRSFFRIFRCCNRITLRLFRNKEVQRAYEARQYQHGRYMYELQQMEHQQYSDGQPQQDHILSASALEFVPTSTPNSMPGIKKYNMQKEVNQQVPATVTPPASKPTTKYWPPVILNGSSKPHDPVVETDDVKEVPPEEEKPDKPEPDKLELDKLEPAEPEPESPPSSSLSSDGTAYATDDSEDNHWESQPITPASSTGSLPMKISIIIVTPPPDDDDNSTKCENWAEEVRNCVDPRYLMVPGQQPFVAEEVQPAHSVKFAPLPRYNDDRPEFDSWADEVEDELLE
ncbi:hypothetical protein Sste5346_009223 [Sporothrix stenoceras]|uniref:Uncharacterized protein n=1 Tax=Sporothrix stenoceras TaxID=5173 RepID=A0ABR3YKT9_9PEZI